jgi:hypothetical protein
MRVLAPRSANIRPSVQPPIDTSGNVLAKPPSYISPNTSEVISEVSEP